MPSYDVVFLRSLCSSSLTVGESAIAFSRLFLLLLIRSAADARCPPPSFASFKSSSSSASRMNYADDLYPPTRPSGRVTNSFGQDLESVIFAVLSFLSGGVILFALCFVVTKCMQCYKARVRRQKRRAMGEEDDDELTDAVMAGAFQGIEDEEETRLVDL